MAKKKTHREAKQAATLRRIRSQLAMMKSEADSAFDCHKDWQTHADEENLWEAIDYLDCLIARAQRVRQGWHEELKEIHSP